MYAHDLELLRKILDFDVDGRPAELSFERRLARECGWSAAYARRVVLEYRRFVYLAMTAGHPVTPSDEVDQAWHLHMTYTRSYWERLCGQVLPRPLHHNPTAGGSAEDAKFADWYQRTLKSYHAAFGHAPPRGVWPSPTARFEPQRQFRRVRSLEFWLVPRAAVRGALWSGVCVLGAAFAMGAAGSGDSSGLAAFALIGGALLIGGAAFWYLARVGRANCHKGDGARANGGCGAGGAMFFDAGGGGGKHHDAKSGDGNDGGNGDSSDGGSSGSDGGSSGCGGGGGCGGGCSS